MGLKKIQGNTYYIPAATNIGVYKFKDRYTLMVDTGDSNQQARIIAETIQGQSFMIKYIMNTHNHIDHSGGNSFLQKHYPGTIIFASEDEKTFLENPYLFSMYIYGGNPVNDLSRHFGLNKKNVISSILSPGTIKINEEKFEVISLGGHSRGQIGIATRDGVFFVADALFSEEIIQKYSFPFLYDIAEQIKTYTRIEETDYEFFVLSHAKRVYNKGEIKKLIQLNRDNLNYYLDLVCDLLSQPKTREELFEEISILQELAIDLNEYYFSISTTAAIITYLFDMGELEYQIENGKLFFYRK
jgi:glyoxylase-like metal-dependent hydrolase (beta-lactamase superfamily II)